MREYDHAIGESKRMLELDPMFPLAYPELGLALVESGRPDEAIAELKQGLAQGHMYPRVKGMLGYAYACAALLLTHGRKTEPPPSVAERRMKWRG